MDSRGPQEHNSTAPEEIQNTMRQVTEVLPTNQSLNVPVAPEPALLPLQPSVNSMATPIPFPAFAMPPFAPYPYYAFSPYPNIDPASQILPSPPSFVNPYFATWAYIPPVPAVYMPPYVSYPFGVPYQFQAFAPEENTQNIHQSEITSSTSSNSTSTVHHDNWGSPIFQESGKVTGLADAGLSQLYSGASGEPAPESESCCICQDVFVEGEHSGILECGHYFHTGCMMEKDECPICLSC